MGELEGFMERKMEEDNERNFLSWHGKVAAHKLILCSFEFTGYG